MATCGIDGLAYAETVEAIQRLRNHLANSESLVFMYIYIYIYIYALQRWSARRQHLLQLGAVIYIVHLGHNVWKLWLCPTLYWLDHNGFKLSVSYKYGVMISIKRNIALVLQTFFDWYRYIKQSVIFTMIRCCDNSRVILSQNIAWSMNNRWIQFSKYTR